MNTTPPYNEQLLLQQTAAGNEAAFTALFYTWQPRLGAFLYKLTESKELTEEILHDIFMKIWMSREALAEVTNFKSYLFVIARNHTLNELDKLETRLRHERKFGEQVAENETNNAFGPQSEKYYYSLIDEAVSQLPERQREVWVLNRIERLTYKQIAAKLGVSPETVKSHLKLATASVTAYISGRKLLVVLFATLGGKIFS